MQTAVVVGPAGEELFTDRYGRIKVRFHWDRDEASSNWVPVAHPSGGGLFSLPEVGDEVLVAFEHGDPDRLVVVGSLSNAADPPPREKR